MEQHKHINSNNNNLFIIELKNSIYCTNNSNAQEKNLNIKSAFGKRFEFLSNLLRIVITLHCGVIQHIPNNMYRDVYHNTY